MVSYLTILWSDNGMSVVTLHLDMLAVIFLENIATSVSYPTLHGEHWHHTQLKLETFITSEHYYSFKFFGRYACVTIRKIYATDNYLMTNSATYLLSTPQSPKGSLIPS